MERYKKRTIALCLASLLTVVGAFGAENYDNTLMALKVNAGSGGYVSVTAFTEKPYSKPIKTSKIDENTFIVTLANTNNSADAPDIDNYENIESIRISTFPYTSDSEGCTRIIIKTIDNPVLHASNAVFIPDNIINSDPGDNEYNEEDEETTTDENYNTDSQVTDKSSEEKASNTPANIKQTYTPTQYRNQSSDNYSREYVIILMCISVLIMLIGLIFTLSKDKMASVVGEQEKPDDKKDKKKKQSKTKKLKHTINKLDNTYSSPDFKLKNVNDFVQQKNNDSNNAELNDETTELQKNIVDLDILFQETQKTTTTTNNTEENNENENEKENESEYDDLADLMSSFVIDNVPEEIQEEEAFDEELYEKIINNKTLKFSDSDIQKINHLLQLEVSSETIEDLEKYLSSPKIKPVTKDQALADLLTTYSLRQNISFTEEDVDAIKKLMNVELSPEFTKDFSTNPARTKAVEKEILENTGKKPHKISEILTLNVKDMLPDLSQELLKQGNKSIKSEVKPSVVYFSEGYEYEKLHVTEDFKSIDINTKENEYKPSFEAPIVESGYNVSTLSIKDELPDLADVKANPEKYMDKKTETKVDENLLLKSISNVTFKPFYDETDNVQEQFKEVQENNTEMNNPSPVQTLVKETKDSNAEKLLLLIEAQKNKRELQAQNTKASDIFRKELEAAVAKKKQPETKQPELYNFEGKNIELLSTVKCTHNSSCKMIHTNNKYIIIGNINDKEIILKEYDALKSSEMSIRCNSKTDKSTYLVKIGLKKFLIRITEDNMEFVMDLC